MSAIYDANEYLIAGLENRAEWWEHLGDAHRDYAALAREAVALRDRAEAAEAECARLQQALADREHWTRRMLQALDAYWLHYDGYHGRGNPRSESTGEDWWIRFEKYRARVEALAGPDTPADSQPEDGTA